MSTKGPIGVLLLAFGGADSVENVEPFVKNVLRGKPITPEVIEKTKDRYKLIGGKSPLLDITRAQSAAIDKALKEEGGNYRMYIGMRYWHPFIKDTLAQMKADGIENAVACIMSPFKTMAATGGYNREVDEAVKAQGHTPNVKFIREWHQSSAFIETVIENLDKELGAFADKKDALVIFSSHSLPLSILEGDPYEMHINQTVAEIIKKTGPLDHKVAFQSKGGGPRWIGPSTEEIIEGAKKAGKKGVIVVPLGFMADHVETLYDIDILFKGIAESSGLQFRRTASLNAAPKVMRHLAGLIKQTGETFV